MMRVFGLALAVVFISVLLVGCSDGESSEPTQSPTGTVTKKPTRAPTRSPTASATPAPTASPTPVPTPEPTPVLTGPTLSVEGSRLKQGGFLLVRLLAPPAGTGDATAYFTGVGYGMSPA